MVNAWSLLYDELYGDDEMSEKKSKYWYDHDRNTSYDCGDIGDTTISGGAGSDVLEIHGAGDYYPGKYDCGEDGLNMTGSAGSDTISFSMNVAAGPVEQVAGGMADDTINFGDYSPVSVASSVVTAATEKDWKDFWKNDNLKFNDSSSVGAGDTSNVSADTLEVIGISGGEGSDTLSFGYDAFGGAGDYYPADHPSQQFWAEDGVSLTGNPGGFCQDTISLGPTRVRGGMGDDHISFSGTDPYPTLGSIGTSPKPSLDKRGVFKYNEDKALKDAQDYVRSTYKGHYTTKGSNTQTLDLIESVGDAESFCRSNAIKYLSRYDKKGTPKNDILKAMHYCLLLYYFSGQTNEIETRGYETF